MYRLCAIALFCSTVLYECTTPSSTPIDIMQRLPLDLSTFKALREGDYVYVDKTMYAYKMITEGRRFFLARPRRFGKSLFVSTLKEILAGNRTLFKGLWIDTSDYTWQKYGIIILDISAFGATDALSLKKGLIYRLQDIAADYKLPAHVTNYDEPGLMLSSLVKALHEQFGYVAILIDEYDNPILHALDQPERAHMIKNTIRDFLTIIKSCDAYVDFVFITGISSFVKAGLFSGINNLRILTLQE